MRNLIFCGDIHGEWNELIWILITRFKIRHADVVVLGDFGVGFDKTLKPNYNEHLGKKLEQADITIYALRGNHDNPEYFLSEDKYSFPRLRFMEDYKVYNLAGRDILVIGGADSTDISWRQSFNSEPKNIRKKKKVWWPEESIVRKDVSELPGKVDFIVSHEAPICFEPIATRFDNCPSEQFRKIVDSREYLYTVMDNVTADYWFYGHYHKSYSGSVGKLLYRGLGIMELYEAPPKQGRNPQE